MPRRVRDYAAEYRRRKELERLREKERARKRKKRKKAKTPRKTAKKTAKLQPPSPRSGVRLPAGAHPGNTGGKVGRSGRRPNIIRDKAAALLEEHELLELAVDIAKGQVQVGEDARTGEPIFLSTSAGERLAAVRFLTERAAGRPPQPIVGDEDEPPLTIEQLNKARDAFVRKVAELATRG
jgi:hypothetical protein